jgi:HlyD family secretion protein
MYEAHMSVANYSKLKSGMPATITIITASANNVILIPESALSYGATYSTASTAKTATRTKGSAASKSATSSSQGQVVVLVNGQPQIKSVVTGLTDNVNVEIISGLSVGDLVITGSTTATKTSAASSSSSSGGGALGGL